jgi:O-antigen/teichoic acid export membrane protein
MPGDRANQGVNQDGFASSSDTRREAKQGLARPQPDLPDDKQELNINQTADKTKTSAGSIRGATTVARDLTTNASGRLALAVLSACSVIITTRMLGPAGYGTVALATVIATLITTVSTTWIGITVRRYGREDLDNGRSMSRLTWNRALIGAPLAVASITTVIALKAIGALPASISLTLVWIIIGSALVRILVEHWTCLLETSRQMKISATSQVVSQTLYIGILVVLFATIRHTSAQTVLALSLGCSFLLAVALIPTVWKLGLVPVAFDRVLLRRMLLLATPMIAFMASEYVLGSIDIIILRIFRSQAEVGVYAVAYQAYTVMARLAISLTAVFVPLFVSLDMAGRGHLIVHYLRRGVPQAMFLLSAAGGLAIPLLPFLVPLMFGHRFEGASTPLAILAPGLLCLFGGYLLAPILTLREATRAVAMINVVAAVVNIVGDALMIGVFHIGISAPAIATTGAMAFEFIVFYKTGRQALNEDSRFDIWMLLPIATGLVPTLAWGGLAGGVVGIFGTIVATVIIILLRSPFSHEDAAMLAKLDLPDIVKRAVVKVAIVGSR